MNSLINTLWKCLEQILRFLLSRVLRLQLSEEQWQQFLQFIKFAVVGASNTVLSYLIYVASLFLLDRCHISFDYMIANILAFTLSVLWSYYWNSRYVFSDGTERNVLKSLLKTYISYSFSGIILSNVLAFIWIDCLHISKYIAPLINLIITVPLNFILNKFWAFR